MKRLLFVFLFLFSQLIYAQEAIQLEIKAEHDPIKQGDAGIYSFVIVGEKLNPSEMRSLILQNGLIKGVFVSNVLSENVSPNQIIFKAYAVFYDKEIPTAVSAKINSTDYQVKIKYFSLIELKDKKDQLQILNQKLPWKILFWTIVLLFVVLAVVGFINRREIYQKLNAKKIARLKKELAKFQKNINASSTTSELNKMKLESKRFKDLAVEKNLQSEVNDASLKNDLEKIYQKRKELYVFNVFSEKQLNDFEIQMNKIQYRPKWSDDEIQELTSLIRVKKGSR